MNFVVTLGVGHHFVKTHFAQFSSDTEHDSVTVKACSSNSSLKSHTSGPAMTRCALTPKLAHQS